MPNCLLIDGNNIIFRAFYAFQNQRLKTSDGVQTGALYGFLRMLLKMLKDRRPDLVAVAFDTSRNTFRRKMFPEYKAKRKPAPEELLAQIPLAHQAVAALGIKIMTHEDYEADDLIGSAARDLAASYQVSIVTGDRDLLQLINDQVTVELCQKGVSDTRAVDPAEFAKEYGFPPAGIIELKALMGDSSDNIPGVKGIGEKKGLALIQQFGSIERLYSEISSVDNEKLRQKLLDDRAMALLSHDLATIRTDVPTFANTVELRWNPDNLNAADFTGFLQRFEFSSLYREFAGRDLQTALKNQSGEAITAPAAVDGQLPGLLPGAAAPLPGSPAPIPGEKLIVSNMADLKNFWAGVNEILAIDVETSGFDPISSHIVGVSLATGVERAVYVPLRHAYLGLAPEDQINPEEFFAFLGQNLGGRKIVGHNLKFDLAFLAEAGVSGGTDLFDTLLAAYVIDPTRSNALKSLGSNLLGYAVTEFNQVAAGGSFAMVDLANAKDYGCQDVLLTMHLYPILQRELAEKKLLKLFNELEMPLIPILQGMERFGIGLNEPYLVDLSRELADRIAELEASVHAHAGRVFNLNSTQQLQEILFKDLGLNPPKKTKTGFSTDSEVLRLLAIAHPICVDLLEYREMAKLKSTYAESLTTLVNPKTGLIHASFNQAVTATGRLSSSNPNMQNIPIKTEWGRKIRRAFIPPRQGDLFVSIDYSQIELRLLAHFSQDPGLVEAYRLGIDIHAISAGRIFKKAPEDVTAAERNVGKTVNFGIIYGISAHGLSEDLAISRPQAKEYIDAFYNGFAHVNEFFEQVLVEARQKGEVETLLGRVRHLPDINSSKFQLRSGAERIAKNTRLQGSAADLVKKAMLDTSRWLCENGFQTRLILQIHDELVFSVPKGELADVAPELKRIMETCVTLNVPLVCDVSSGPNLADLDDLP
ncbi:MAG TPA: DNA polymerase I [Candidatus Rifleibacterium sp.]|nr:DNA polymerase I [Candidatus Rifleibacterium sp.]HPT45991.1 DNA polymerase I [Candidatus Rifleibacterium sp.]